MRAIHSALGLLLVVALCTFVNGADESRRPNVVLIMADDLGYETIGANGGTSYKTPHLDALAAGGMRFEHCYVQPLCTPTRVQLMTGAYNVRNYITFGQMDPKLTTFGNLFQKAGYRTAIVGKWQLGPARNMPSVLGFDEHCLWQHTRRPPRYANPGLEINGEEKNFHNGEYGPDLLNDYALNFVSENKDKPFFLYYPMTLTHAPYQATPDSAEWDPKAMGENANRRPKHFGDMVEYMDKLVGKLVARLDELKLRENTLVIFLGDNGTGKGTPSQMGTRTVIGGKGTTTAAGMRVPLIVNWPGRVAPGKVTDDLIDSTDILPTICAAGGVPLPDGLVIDGQSFWPRLRGEAGQPRAWIYSWYSPRGEALREFAFDHRYKLYRNGMMHDLQADPDEKTPLPVATLTGEAADRAGALQKVLDQFVDARPENLPQPEGAVKGAKKAKKRKKS